MPEFSLIVATKGRADELGRLIRSLDEQQYADYELIIVDQNDDDRLLPVIESSAYPHKISHLRCGTGASRARNVGIKHACGQILAFPDDDCWYPPNLLKSVSEWFHANPAYDMLSVTSRDDDGRKSCNRWFQQSCDIALINVYRTSAAATYFIRATERVLSIRYDEGIGPGAATPYLGGEDSDYVLALLHAGVRGRFEAKWHIGHPLKDIRDASISKDRAYIYGQGMGFVQRKHRLVWLSLLQLAFDHGRALCAYLVGRREPAKLWYWHGRGVMDGFLRRLPEQQINT